MISKKDTIMLKGIAILMVITQHIGQAFHVSIVNPLGPIGVFIFLFLSGYGLSVSYEKNGVKKYLSKRIIKVYIPYLLSIALFCLWLVFLQKNISWQIIVEYMFLISLPQGSFWFLIILFFWYAVFYLLTYVYKYGKLLVIMMLIASFVIIALKRFEHGYIWQFFSFPLGVFCVRYKEFIENIAKKTNFILLEIVLFLIAIILSVLKKMPFVEANELGTADTLLQIGITLSVGIFTMILCRWIEKIRFVKSAFYYVGVISYELYLSHVIALDYLRDNYSINSLMEYLLVSALCTLVIVLFNKFVINVVEKKLIDGGKK